ncbi:hypothetical protein GF385_01445 [Candidatus Dependentiae bacterium]|nr:hypothetical protein [Candidatus Dependentiae bacterium]
MKVYKKLLALFLLSLFSLNLSAKLFYNVQDDDPEIIVAVKEQNLERLQELIEKGVDLEEKCREEGTALGWAFYFKWLEGVKVLLKAGANIEYETADGTNLWHLLMLSGQKWGEEEGRKTSLKLYKILKKSGLKMKKFTCDSLNDIEDYSEENPELVKRFFSDIRFKKMCWWLYRFGYKPLLRFTDIFIWMEENFGKD